MANKFFKVPLNLCLDITDFIALNWLLNTELYTFTDGITKDIKFCRLNTRMTRDVAEALEYCLSKFLIRYEADAQFRKEHRNYVYPRDVACERVKDKLERIIKEIDDLIEDEGGSGIDEQKT